ncbi:MAG: NADH-quinone oxidoreductase subunit L [Planctomycetota bacterium]|jgi:NADH-quinone oxidoreductase subunit L
MSDLAKVLLVLVPSLPLAAALVTAALGKRVLRERSHLPAVAAIGAAFVCSFILLILVQIASNRAGREVEQAKAALEQGSLSDEETAQALEQEKQVGFADTVTLWTWASVDEAYRQTSGTESAAEAKARGLQIDVVLRADPLTAFMLVTVTFVSFLVTVYSIGYMHGDEGYWRFFTYIPLFVFSMTMLVSVSNFVLLYVFWEAVGLCSYLLIGFWFQKPSAAAAGKKAFLVNRVGDFGFALGIFFLWTTYGTLNFHDADGVAGLFGQARLCGDAAFVHGNMATAISLLLLLGACGKSAQFPLHVWLPDAMEGPTPVSALIHAATMVTAGVYMVARCAPLFSASTDALCVVAVVGAFTALLAAAIALTQTDLKRILAYSTISQLGYMFLGLGAGTLLGIAAGMFHLFTHAFFKALLFLGAGSVMHAMGGVIDIRRFGGLRRRLPTTHWTFLVGCLALAGVVPFAGFFSKDEILAAVHQQPSVLYQTLYWAALFTAFLTAFYTFRAFFLTFYGEERIPQEAGDHAHESPRPMTVPLMILAACSVLAGLFFWWVRDFLAQTPSIAYVAGQAGQNAEAAGGVHWGVMIASTLVAAAGIGLAWLAYIERRTLAERLAKTLKPLYRLSYGKFFFDPIYNVLVILPLRGIAWASYWLDRHVVDGLVNLCGRVPVAVGASLRSVQSGMIQFYALAMVLGLLVLIVALVM